MQQYTVQAGDTPWSLAQRYTGRSTRWGELVGANPHKPRARDGNFAQLEPGEVLTLPPGWPSPAHGRTSPAPSSARSFVRSSNDAAGELEVRPPRPLETSSTPDKVTWIDVPKGDWDYPGRHTSDLRYFDTAKNPAPDKEWWSDRAWDMWLDMADAVKADPEALLAASYSESIGLAPWRVGPTRDPKTGKMVPFAWGLFQITKAQNRNAGVSDEEHRTWLAEGPPHTVEQQIPFLRRYWEALNASYRKGAGFAGYSPAALYAYNFMPAHVRSGEDSVLLLSNRPEDKHPVLEQLYWPVGYEANKGLDRDKDGRITIGEMGQAIRDAQSKPRFALALERLNRARARRSGGVVPIEWRPPQPPAPRPPPGRPAPTDSSNVRGGGGGALLLLGLAAAAYYAFSARRGR